MTPKEAIEKLTVLKRFMNPISRNDVAIDTAISALEKADKYAWHDLREDPTDLPKVGAKVIVFGVDGAFNCYQVCIYSTGICEGFEYLADNTSFYFEKPIAWREIEPFEEIKL